MTIRSMNSTRPQSPLAPETIFHPAYDWNTSRDTMPLMYSTLTGIRSRSSIKANDGKHNNSASCRAATAGASHLQSSYSSRTNAECLNGWPYFGGLDGCDGD